VNSSPAFSLFPVVFMVVAVGAAWALLMQRRRLGLVLTAAGLAVLIYAVAWTFLPE
jgi:cytochrome bd-type quinol oxidase subunit 2